MAPDDPPGDDPPPGDPSAGRAEPERSRPAFTFEGQMDRLQHWVRGINRRGGREKRIVQVLVITGLALLALAYASAILWGIFS